MSRIKMIVAYDGTEFFGWQIQPDRRTVQSELQKGLANLLKQDIKVTGAGRTDAGVHAVCQVVHFDVDDIKIPPHKLKFALRRYLPKDIGVITSEEADCDFHACFSAKKRVYRYRFITDFLYPHQRNYYASFEYKFNYDKLCEIMNELIGKHDFTTFSLKDCDVKTRLRNIEKISIDKTSNGFDIVFTADGFLRKMIRMITGTLLIVYPYDDAAKRMKDILNKKDNYFSGPPAVPGGLYLERVYYKN